MSSPSLVHRNNFNLLRLFFALLVLLSHAPEMVDGNRSRELLTHVFNTVSFGEFAVDGFFLLSGYLIVQSWCSAPHIGTFLKKRALRIYPGFVVATLISVFIVGALGATRADEYYSQISIPVIVKGMLQLRAPAGPEVFQGQPYAMVNGAMWTISYEFKCYLAVLVLGALGLVARRFVWLAATVVLIAVLIVLGSNFPSLDGNGVAKLFRARVDYFRLASFFFTGGCFYLYREYVRFNGVMALLAMAVLGVGMFSPSWAELLLAPFGGYLLFYAGFKQVPLLAVYTRWPDVSYGVYLYGWPAQKLLLWYVPSMSPWLLFVLSSTVAVIMGLFSWYLVEKPSLRLKGVPNSRSNVVAIP